MKYIYSVLAFVLSCCMTDIAAQSFSFHSNAPFGIQVTREDGTRVARSMHFFDADGDEDLDLFLTGLDVIDDFESWEGVHYFIEYQENIGDKWFPLFTGRDTLPEAFPFPVGYFLPAIGDLNLDTKPDFMVNGEVNAHGGRTLHYIQSNGRSSGAAFDVIRGDTMGLIDFLPESAFFPDLVDLDQDGDLDLLMSGLNPAFMEEDGADVPKTLYAVNTGTASSPEFVGWYSNPYGLTPHPLSEMMTTGDIDKDGDIDVLGSPLSIPVDSMNKIMVHLNSTGAIAFGPILESPFGLPTSFGEEQFFFPRLVDLDGDSDLDLFVFKGTSAALELEYYENTLCAGSITTLNAFLCEGESIEVAGQLYSEEGGYTIVLDDANGCDSTIFLGIIIYESFNININESICEGESIIVAGNTYTDAGDYTIVLQDANGCDSTIFLSLAVNEVYSTNLSETICEGETLNIGGNIFTDAGDYMIALQSIHGCDSTIFLSLAVHDIAEVSLNETICDGDSVIVGSETFTQAGDYTIVLTDINGCDSLILLSLAVDATFSIGIVETICDGDVYTIGTENFTETGQYQVLLFSQTGCDSLITLDLNVIEFDKTVTLNGSTLTANLSGALYQWIDCSSGADISGATNQSYEVLVTGNYAVNITASGCSVTSECVSVVISGVAEATLSKSITVYPNPTDELIYVLNGTQFQVSIITVTNVSGQVVGRFLFNEANPLDVSYLEQGLYFVRIQVDEFEIVKKLIVI